MILLLYLFSLLCFYRYSIPIPLSNILTHLYVVWRGVWRKYSIFSWCFYIIFYCDIICLNNTNVSKSFVVVFRWCVLTVSENAWNKREFYTFFLVNIKNNDKYDDDFTQISQNSRHQNLSQGRVDVSGFWTGLDVFGPFRGVLGCL